MCYICAMIPKGSILLAILVVLAPPPSAILAQAGAKPANSNTTVPAKPSAGTLAAPGSSTSGQNSSSAAPTPGTPPNCEGAGCDYQPAHITVATPAPAPAPWPMQDRIAWGANVLLALLGYAGIMLGIQTLKKIERQSKYSESAAEIAAKSAEAAAKSAEAALLHAQAIINAERPWVLITIVPSRSIENGFTVIATNRGRGPAQVVAALEETRIAIDETHLPSSPEFQSQDSETLLYIPSAVVSW